MNNETVGDRLRLERERLDLSVTATAKIGGIGRTVQYSYEKNASKPDTDYLSRVAAVGFDVLYIITGIRTPKGNDTLGDDEARLVKNYNQVDSTGKTAAQQLLSTLAEAKKRAA